MLLTVFDHCLHLVTLKASRYSPETALWHHVSVIYSTFKEVKWNCIIVNNHSIVRIIIDCWSTKYRFFLYFNINFFKNENLPLYLSRMIQNMFKVWPLQIVYHIQTHTCHEIWGTHWDFIFETLNGSHKEAILSGWNWSYKFDKLKEGSPCRLFCVPKLFARTFVLEFSKFKKLRKSQQTLLVWCTASV